MKTLTLIAATILIGLSTANAQHYVTKTYIERTHVSPKSGLAIGFETQNKLEIGGFYQESYLMEKLLKKTESPNQMPRFYEKEFYGVYFNYPVVDKRFYDVKFNIRTGVINNQIMAINVACLANFKPVEFINIGTGIGIRAFRPTLQGSVSFRI